MIGKRRIRSDGGSLKLFLRRYFFVFSTLMILEANCSGPRARSPGRSSPLDLDNLPVKEKDFDVQTMLVKSPLCRRDAEPSDGEEIGVREEGDFEVSS